MKKRLLFLGLAALLTACRVEITAPPEGSVQIDGPFDSVNLLYCEAGSICLVELTDTETNTETRAESINFFAQPADPSTHVHVGWKQGDGYICGDDNWTFGVFGACEIFLRDWGRDEGRLTEEELFALDVTLKLEPVFAPINRVGGNDFATALNLELDSAELFVSKSGGGCDYFSVNIPSGGNLYPRLTRYALSTNFNPDNFSVSVVDVLQNRFNHSAALQPGLQYVLVCTPTGSGRMPYELTLLFSQG